MRFWIMPILSLTLLGADCGEEPSETPTQPAATPTQTATPTQALTPPPGQSLDNTLLISAYTSNTVFRADRETGAILGNLGPVAGAQSVRRGPDNHLYIVAEGDNAILRFDGETGQALGPFVADDLSTPEDETGGMTAPTSAVFGPDGNLYVGSFSTNEVFRYDGTTGAFIDIFVEAGAGNLRGADSGMIFGPDGDLYVPSYYSHRINRYDGSTGAFIDSFLGLNDGLRSPRALAFEADGDLWVTSWGTSEIYRFTAQGAPIGRPIELSGPTGLVILEDEGEVWVCSDQTSDVYRYDLATGDLLGQLISGSDAGIQGATWLFLTD